MAPKNKLCYNSFATQSTRFLNTKIMSGHSKWHSIKHKKGAADAKRGKIFTQHAKMIALAAQQGGGDIDTNPALRAAIDRAKLDNLPNANIDRAIKRGTGELKEGSTLSEVVYEGYGPGGVAVYVHVVTDNKNRAVSNVRNIFTKHGGSLGEAGCVGWMFERKGLILLNTAGMDADTIEMTVIESGADDLTLNGDVTEVITAYQDLNTVKHNLEQAGMKIEKAELIFHAKEQMKIDNESTAGKIVRLMEALEEDEDVTLVSSNFDISEEILEKLHA